jgi:hypothetical protein
MASPSPSKLPSLRGILLARTHFEVLGLDTTSALAVRDLTDADVRAAYRRLALRCHPDKCPHEVNAQTAFVRVARGGLGCIPKASEPPHPTPYTLHPTPYPLHPTPYTLHPTPYTLHPTPYTLHPTPYTLHPTLHTTHPTNTPYTVNPKP